MSGFIRKYIKLSWISPVIVIAFTIGCNTVNPPVFGGTVKDIDGNVYNTVTIGTQTWMIENLKTTHFNDNTVIPMVTDSAAWINLKTPGYCWYNNDSTSNKNTFGALYNWQAASSKLLAPKGWHIPTEADWDLLENKATDYLYISGSLSKILASKTNWAKSTKPGAIGNNLTLNNSCGFNALPGGMRDTLFNSLGSSGVWWSSTLKSDTTSLAILLNFELSTVEKYNKHPRNGFSVRCIKDSN
jgi:uncharacterized protein (TIGR02145 family)